MLTEKQSSTFSDDPERKSQRFAALATLLLFLALGFGIYQWNRGNTLTRSNETLTDQVDSLKILRDGLTREIQAVSTQLETARTQNSSLSASLTGLNEKLAERDRVLARLRAENNSIPSLRRQVLQLSQVKASLTEELDKLRQDNTRLAEENTRLREENRQLTSQNDDLRNRPEEPEKEAPTGPLLKANALRVEVVQRRDRLTVRARRAREIAVMVELPKELQSEEPNQMLYLSMKDVQQRPLEDKEARKMTIDVPGVMNPVTVHLAQKVDFQKNPQRITLKYKPDEKLKAGIYAAELFTEQAFLGRVEFRLR
ncbi:hypothetical protein [Tellurirhabdus rosea]|uniref:hypothetical protein n=1 Tax=Tellurirhabdus rosea TaxID=2674997 RepID=UPI0022584AE7|nr:hypothetical protein [Tellurirhabdus rosea]